MENLSSGPHRSSQVENLSLGLLRLCVEVLQDGVCLSVFSECFSAFSRRLVTLLLLFFKAAFWAESLLNNVGFTPTRPLCYMVGLRLNT